MDRKEAYETGVISTTGGCEPETFTAPVPVEAKDASGQHACYWVLSEAERAKGFVRPVRQKYVHTVCGVVTSMGWALAETYARDPKFYGSTFCVGCGHHYPVGEFRWDGFYGVPRTQAEYLHNVATMLEVVGS